MDIEKLIETLRQRGVAYVRAYGRYCSICDEVVTALSTLQAENEKLRAELEQVKRERDAAVDDLETIMFVGGQNTDTCMYCKNGQCYDRGGSQPCSPQWRDPRKEN